MMIRIRSTLAVMLALVLGLTSYELAAARGQAPAAGTVEICSGLGLQIITVDSNGNPVGAPNVCPDGIAAFISIAVPPPVLPQRLVASAKRPHLPLILASAEAERLSATARGPPIT